MSIKKVLFLFLLLSIPFYKGNSQDLKAEKKITIDNDKEDQAISPLEFTKGIKFKDNRFILDYGKIKKGSNRVRIIEIRNKGDQPLIIREMTSTCGCTIPSWPKKPILPKKTAEISVKYDTDRVGSINKNIQMSYSYEGKEYKKTILIRGEVK